MRHNGVKNDARMGAPTSAAGIGPASPEPRVTDTPTASPTGTAIAALKAAQLKAVKDAQIAQYGACFIIEDPEEFLVTQVTHAEAGAILRNQDPTSLVQLSVKGQNPNYQAIVEQILPHAIGMGMTMTEPIVLSDEMI